jgi:excinuclease ABC subunit B
MFQIVGRAARNVEGKAILYADKITKSMQKVIDETNRRRQVQREYNEEHGITPQTIQKELKPLVDPALISTQDFTLDSKPDEREQDYLEVVKVAEDGIQYRANPAMKEVTFESKEKFLDYLRESMLYAAKNMEFEEAARIRDQIATLEKEL